MVKAQTIQDITSINDNDTSETSTPIIVKHQSTNTQINNVQKTDSSNGDDTARINTVSNAANTVTPPSEPTNQAKSETSSDTTIDNTQTTQKVSSETVKENEPATFVANEPYAAVDALPSKSAQDTTATTNDMQQPRIYDTKEYFVPIHDTTHKHGHMLGTVIAGIISALLVLTIIYFVARDL